LASIIAESFLTERPGNMHPDNPPRSLRRRIRFAIAAVLAVVIISAISWIGLHSSRNEERTALPHLSPTPSSNSPVHQQPSIVQPTSPPSQTYPGSVNCPPACDRIPDAAWIDPSAVPLYSTYSWPPLAGLAATSSRPRFRFEEPCSTPRPQYEQRDGTVAAKSILTHPPDQWQLQVQIIHWRGDPWVGGQRASTTMDWAAAALRACKLSTSQVSVSVSADAPGNGLAAVVSVGGAKPIVIHQYLVSDVRNSTIVEVAMWTSSPPRLNWPETNDRQLIDAMIAPLCRAYVDSCLS
jgi:hypothetical protein